MKYVALLRGINVGGNNKVPMPELKGLFLDIGFASVKTYINSGNVICSGTKAQVAMVELAFAERFGFPIRFLFISESKFKTVHSKIPSRWKNDAEQKTDVWFLWEEYNHQSVLKELTIVSGVDEVCYMEGAIIWHVLKKNFTKSGINQVIGTDLYKHITARNVNTVRKLMELLES